MTKINFTKRKKMVALGGVVVLLGGAGAWVCYELNATPSAIELVDPVPAPVQGPGQETESSSVQVSLGKTGDEVALGDNSPTVKVPKIEGATVYAASLQADRALAISL